MDQASLCIATLATVRRMTASFQRRWLFYQRGGDITQVNSRQPPCVILNQEQVQKASDFKRQADLYGSLF